MNLLDEPCQLCCQYRTCPSLPFLRWVRAEREDTKWSLTLHPEPRLALRLIWLVPTLLPAHYWMPGGCCCFQESQPRLQQCSITPLKFWGEGKFSLLCWLISMLLLWLHSSDCQVCSCVSSALTIQRGPFLLPGMCSVHVLCLCLHGHLQNCEHFRSLLY